MRSVALRDTAASIRRSAQDPLGIYLNDHLAGATAGLELARRVAGARQVPATGPECSGSPTTWPRTGPP